MEKPLNLKKIGEIMKNIWNIMEFFLTDKILCIIFMLAELQRLWKPSTTVKQKIAAHMIFFLYILVKEVWMSGYKGRWEAVI